jgi:hypothetical protein
VIVLDDFVMLGKTVPEPNADGRVFVCSAGYSDTLRSLVRVYPLGRYDSPPRWSVSTARLERNPKDARAESFKLAGDRSADQHWRINSSAFTVTGKVSDGARARLMQRYAADSIADANADRASLAVIHPSAVELEFEHNPASPDSPELSLFDLPGTPPTGARRFPYIPRLRFQDDKGEHRLQLRDWGVYELMRKHNNLTSMTETERRRYVGQALHLDSSCSLLVGNMNNQRTAWLVISVMRGLRAAPSLFDEVTAA